MSLTRKFLKELELTDEVIEPIIAAHVAVTDALKQERDEYRDASAALEGMTQERDAWREMAGEHQASLEALRAEYEGYQAETEEHRHQAARREALTGALRAAGANPQAIPLLLDALPLPADCWNGDALADEGGLMAKIRAKYSPMFSDPIPLATARVSPPVDMGGVMTQQDLRRMSPDDINRNWDIVATALKR